MGMVTPSQANFAEMFASANDRSDRGRNRQQFRHQFGQKFGGKDIKNAIVDSPMSPGMPPWQEMPITPESGWYGPDGTGVPGAPNPNNGPTPAPMGGGIGSNFGGAYQAPTGAGSKQPISTPFSGQGGVASLSSLTAPPVAMKKGGAVKKKTGGASYGSKIDLGHCKVSTTSKNKKQSNW